MPSRASRLIRSRLVWPVTLVFAVATLATSEFAYRVARASAGQAVEINATRWAIHRLQLSAADLELSWRGVVMTGDPAFRERFAAGRQAMEKELAALRARYADAKPQDRDNFDRLARIYTTRIDDMVRVLQVRDGGDAAAAGTLLDQKVAQRVIEDADPAAKALLQRAVAELVDERDRFFEALTFGRSGVILMTLAALVGVGAYRHASTRLHRQQEQQRAALYREREQLESTVAQRTQELRKLARHLQTAVENERAVLARELHDELGALLTAAKLDVARLKSKLPSNAEVEARVAHLNAMLNDGIALKRRIIESLRPSALNNLGLVPALEMLIRETQERLGVPVTGDLVPVEASSEAALTIYRFVQEALTNVARHAQANRVRVALHGRDGLIHVEVHDDGVGFDPAGVDARAHGLSGMRFRVESLGGTMVVASRPGDTRLTANVPALARSTAVAA